MDFRGFYPEDAEAVNIPMLTAANLFLLSQHLITGEKVSIHFTGDRTLPGPNQVSVAAYNPVNHHKSNGQVVRCLAFSLSNKTEAWQQFYEDTPDSAFWLEVWDSIFHELRHFVQHRLFRRRTKRMLGIDDLARVEEQSPELAEFVRLKYDLYKKLSWRQQRYEADAIITSLIALAKLDLSFKDGQIDLAQALPILLLTGDSLRNLDLSPLKESAFCRPKFFADQISFEIPPQERIISL